MMRFRGAEAEVLIVWRMEVQRWRGDEIQRYRGVRNADLEVHEV